MRGRDIVVIGASAGGVDALRTLVGALPAGFPASVFIVMHLSPHAPSQLAEVLARAGRLPVAAVDRPVQFRPGQVYVAPPNRHLVLSSTQVRVRQGPRENWHRPSVDVLFRTAAEAHGPRVIGIVLTGFLDDGSAGLAAIQREGGLAIVQDPDDALFPDMPRNALESVKADHCLPLADIPRTLLQRVRQVPARRAENRASKEVAIESAIATSTMDSRDAIEKIGKASGFTCPECAGPVWELKNGEPLNFRCQVGHAFSTASMLTSQDDLVERSLWIALGALEQREALWRRISERLDRPQLRRLAGFYEGKEREARRDIDGLRKLLNRLGRPRHRRAPKRSSPRPRRGERMAAEA
jgi:two-component system, chemotaxis family, protein-glutamate methylesterase/glutaminase